MVFTVTIDGYAMCTFLEALSNRIDELGRDKTKIKLWMDKSTSNINHLIRQLCLRKWALSVIVASTVFSIQIKLTLNNFYNLFKVLLLSKSN